MSHEILATLRSISLFADLGDDDLEKLAAAATIRSFDDGDIVFREGQPGQEVFIVCDGQAAVEICAPGMGCRRLVHVGAGQLLGWTPLFGVDQPLTATARAADSLRVIAIDAAQLRELFERRPKLGYRFMRQVAMAIARRLAATRMQLLDLYRNTALE